MKDGWFEKYEPVAENDEAHEYSHLVLVLWPCLFIAENAKGSQTQEHLVCLRSSSL